MYSSYTAASFARLHEMAAREGVNLEGALTWAFEFEDQPPFAGFRALASDGLDLPVLNVFRMFAKMRGQRLPVISSAGLDAQAIRARGVRGEPDVSALAARDGHQLWVMLWHYHDDDLPGPDAAVSLTLHGLSCTNARVRQYRIDADHSNAYEAWKRLGSPSHLDPTQYAQLEQAGQLAELGPLETLQIKDGEGSLHLSLPRQAVALLEVSAGD
jgi:xylan 1,4-beta-xylosidase